MENASTARRFAALTLDWLMCLFISGLLAAGSFGKDPFVPLGLFFVEVTILTTLQQASAGQRILRLRVIDSNTGGQIRALQVAIRTFLICLVLPAIFKKDGRFLHEIFSSSRVIKI